MIRPAGVDDTAVVGKGIGLQLYGQLIRLLQAAGLHVAVGAISLPNDSSVALHEKLGYKRAGCLREVGWKFDRWVDVGYWRLML